VPFAAALSEHPLAAEAVGAALLTMGLLASQGYGGQMAEGFGVAGTSSGTAAGMDMGALYIALTSSLAYISGAALNPAISLAFVLQGKRELRLRGLEAADCLLAMGVQLASAIVATLVYGAMLPTGQSLPPSALMRWHRPTEPGGRARVGSQADRRERCRGEQRAEDREQDETADFA